MSAQTDFVIASGVSLNYLDWDAAMGPSGR